MEDLCQQMALDRCQIMDVLDSDFIARLGLCNNCLPYVVPMFYAYETCGEDLVIYMCSCSRGQKIISMERDPNVMVQVERQVDPKTGGCMSCNCGCSSSYGRQKYGSGCDSSRPTWDSVMASGTAELIDDDREKEKICKKVLERASYMMGARQCDMMNSYTAIRIYVRKVTGRRFSI